jgi:uncharacterized Tic20 family protein
MTGWIANSFILVGMYLIGEKRPCAFGFSITGELIWSIHAYRLGMYDLAAICFVFCFVAAYNWRKWRRVSQP